MAVIKKYTKRDGGQAYMFNAYLGVDPLTGKKKRTTRRGFRTAKDAKLALAKLLLEVESKGFVKQDYSLFTDVYELWFSQYVNTVKVSSAKRIKSYFDNQILPVFGEMRLNKITIAFCQNAVNKWWKEYKTYQIIKAYTQKLLDFSINQGLIENNPMRNIIMPKRKKELTKKQENFLEKEELKAFLEEILDTEPYQYYVIFRVLAYTGMRKGEILALLWEDIDFTQAAITINKTVSYVGRERTITSAKTASSNRTISLDNETLSILKKWKLEQKKGYSRTVFA